jgi:threonine/homoserine efflux transporter RhtA
MLVPFQVAALLSAALIFSIEPMIAKRLLPAFGGAPMVWKRVHLFSFVVVFVTVGSRWRDFANRALPVLVVPLVLFMAAR